MSSIKDILAVTAQNSYRNSFWNAMKHRTVSSAELGGAVDGSTGAYFMPADSENRFREIITENGSVRSLASVCKKYDGSSSIWAYESDAYADFVDEGDPIPGFDAKDDFTQIRVNAYKLASLAKVSSEFAYDAGFDVEKYIMKRLGKAFARAEDKAFISGTGEGEPTGILRDTKGAEISGTVDSLTYDSCIDLFFSVKPEYRKNAVWLMNDSTALTLRKLKDEAGNYLWNTANDTILGRPVIICNEMPDADTGEKPVAFGDFSFYVIVDRSPASLKVLHELYAVTNQVGYVGYERLDGMLIRSEAVKVIKITEEERG